MWSQSKVSSKQTSVCASQVSQSVKFTSLHLDVAWSLYSARNMSIYVMSGFFFKSFTQVTLQTPSALSCTVDKVCMAILLGLFFGIMIVIPQNHYYCCIIKLCADYVQTSKQFKPNYILVLSGYICFLIQIYLLLLAQPSHTCLCNYKENLYSSL